MQKPSHCFDYIHSIEMRSPKYDLDNASSRRIEWNSSSRERYLYLPIQIFEFSFSYQKNPIREEKSHSFREYDLNNERSKSPSSRRRDGDTNGRFDTHKPSFPNRERNYRNKR